MIRDAIERVENNKNIEEVALSLHKASKGLYVVVDENLDYKIISMEKFNFNTKYNAMDFYSRILGINKAVDKKKLIQSNNYLTFFCRNVGKLTDEVIDNFYTVLKCPDKKYKNWIKKNIISISNVAKDREIIKVFFKEDIKTYKKLGTKYFEENVLSHIKKYEDEIYGTVLYNLNLKKPYLRNLSRKIDIPNPLAKKEGLKYKYFEDILLSLIKKGYDMLYILEDGTLIPFGPNKEEYITSNLSFVNGLIFVYTINSRGMLDILHMDTIPAYRNKL